MEYDSIRGMAHKLKILGSVLFASVILLALWRTMQTKEGFVLGAKNCTEQHLLAEITAQLIEKNSSIKVIRRFNLEGTSLCFNALKNGQIDAYYEYTGTALLDILKRPYVRGQAIYELVKEEFAKRYDLIWLERIGFSNQYALVTRSDLGLTKLSEALSQNLRVAFDPEFAARHEAKLLAQLYPYQSPLLMDQVLLYLSLLNENVELISGFSTDGRLLDTRLVKLEDDLQLFPAYEVALVIRREILEKFPAFEPIFAQLIGRISEEEMRKLNYQVEILGQSVETVAKSFIAKLD